MFKEVFTGFINKLGRINVSDDLMKAEVNNVVATVDLRCKINLTKAASIMPGDTQVRYIPEQFPGVIVRIKKPKVTILVFSTGKLVVTGAKSAEMIREAVEVISELLREAGHNIAHEATITVQNIVASGTLGKRINLELAALLLEHTMYEPEQFPGLIYRMREPKVVLLLFQSGKLVCTGAKKEEDVEKSLQKIYSILTEIDAFEVEFTGF